jgi:hypothetical protein
MRDAAILAISTVFSNPMPFVVIVTLSLPLKKKDRVVICRVVVGNFYSPRDIANTGHFYDLSRLFPPLRIFDDPIEIGSLHPGREAIGFTRKVHDTLAALPHPLQVQVQPCKGRVL